jgi:hypothetical protein
MYPRALPENLPVERPGFHIQPAIVAQQVRMGQPERLIVNKKLKILASVAGTNIAQVNRNLR